VPNVKNNHHIAVDRKQHPILMRLPAIDELAHFKWEIGILRSDRAALGKFGK
jgi:hypothetical protein